MQHSLMTRFFRRAWLPIIMTALLTSCSYDEPVETEEETYTLSFRLSTGGIFSRATWGDEDYDEWTEGTAFDQTISSVDLFLIDSDNNLTPLYALEQPGTGGRIFTLQIDDRTPGVTIDKTTRKATFNGRIMALANIEDAHTPWNDPSDWLTKKLPFNIGFTTVADWHIPMWGIESFSNVIIEPNRIRQLDDIHMLRAVAKIEIKLDPSLEDDFEISGVRMEESSQCFKGSGYNLPDKALEYTSTKNITRDRCIALREDAREMGSLPFRKSITGSWITYVSESRLNNNEKPFSFNVTLRSKSENQPEFNGTLHLAYYQPANPAVVFAPIKEVVRNHTYQFTLKLADLSFIPTVKVWEFGGKVHIELE